MREKQIDKLKDYKYGFTTDIESIKAPKELNKEVISVRPHQWKIVNDESSKNSSSLSCKIISTHPKGVSQELKVQYKKLMLTVDVEIKYPIELGLSLIHI